MKKQPKVAIVCDWLTGTGGAERVVLELHKMFPDAPIYTKILKFGTAINGLQMPMYAHCGYSVCLKHSRNFCQYSEPGLLVNWI
jgi:hypothetical protein